MNTYIKVLISIIFLTFGLIFFSCNNDKEILINDLFSGRILNKIPKRDEDSVLKGETLETLSSKIERLLKIKNGWNEKYQKNLKVYNKLVNKHKSIIEEIHRIKDIRRTKKFLPEEKKIIQKSLNDAEELKKNSIKKINNEINKLNSISIERGKVNTEKHNTEYKQYIFLERDKRQKIEKEIKIEEDLIKENKKKELEMRREKKRKEKEINKEKKRQIQIQREIERVKIRGKGIGKIIKKI
ncbi:hypothetical protein [Blattabacterium cuenoti]|uniref:hypothetical protein n=1 Tax=Blattabacterium cuenoti TaxID=1653831 RepID=UPI00163CA698|nr:hypothetical protein [Blattabacterium cuenoti]